MRKCLCAFALALALGCPAFAGVIHNPPPPSDGQERTAQGQMETPLLVQMALTLVALL